MLVCEVDNDGVDLVDAVIVDVLDVMTDVFLCLEAC